MGTVFLSASSCSITLGRNYSMVTFMGRSNTRIYNRKIPKSLYYPQLPEPRPDLQVNLLLKKPSIVTDPSQTDSFHHDTADSTKEEEEEEEGTENDTFWDSDEEDAITENDAFWDSDEEDAISSLFQGRIPQKPGKLNRERPLPLPLPHKIRPSGFPTPKKHIKLASPKVASSRVFLSKKVYKNPTFLIGLAKDIRNLSSEEDVSVILNQCSQFLRKGSLSLTIRELGEMGLPTRALQTFCWAQKQPHLFPDDLILATTIEVLARSHELKVPPLENFASSASREVLEAMVRGFVRRGSLKLALRLLHLAKIYKRKLDPSIYVNLIFELGKNPEKQEFVLPLLDELGEREDLNLRQQDCTAMMKVCTRLGIFDAVENLFKQYKERGRDPTIVMYTTLVHSRYCREEYREALAAVLEMESSNCLFDLPAYRVVIKLFVALNDLSRAARYFSKLKEAGFSPPFDMYKDMIQLYIASGRLAKCKEICKEAETSGFTLNKRLKSQLLQLEETRRISG